MGRLNKHNANRHVATVGGQECKFDSMAEHRYADWLERQRKAKRIVSWRFHPAALCVLADTDELCRLNVDFAVVYKSGLFEWHEVKGMATPVWRLKRHILSVMQPDTAYVVIDAGRGVCKDGKGEPALFDDRPRRKRRKK